MRAPVSDCEPIRAGPVAQPVNTASAAAYLLAGAWLLARAPAAACPPLARAYAVAVAAVGLGSGWYHAGGGPSARWVHDVTLLLPLVVAAGGTLAALVRGGAGWWHRRAGSHRARALGLALAALALAAPFQLLGRTGGPLCRGGAVPAHGIWHVLTAVALAAAGVVVIEPLAVTARSGTGDSPRVS